VLYHLLTPLAKQHIIFNLFNYITFRAAGATVTALLFAFVIGPWIINRLRTLRVGQVIRAEGPASHQGKRGTPTMGGLIIILSTVVPTLLWARLDTGFVVVAGLGKVLAGGGGVIDDHPKNVGGQAPGVGGGGEGVGQGTHRGGRGVGPDPLA